jgi:glutamine amidotransferase
MKVTIMDYGVGNLHSLSKGLERAGASTEVVSDPAELLGAECIVFPGVGAFGAAAAAIAPVMGGLRARIGSGTPALGICLGMQLMFERSEESPGAGLSAFDGDVRRVLGPRVPHMGWNEVVSSGDDLFDGVEDGARFYFANSYVCHPRENVGIAETTYGEMFVSAVRKGRLCGVQFHPEKSGVPGLRVLSNFVRLAEDSG